MDGGRRSHETKQGLNEYLSLSLFLSSRNVPHFIIFCSFNPNLALNSVLHSHFLSALLLETRSSIPVCRKKFDGRSKQEPFTLLVTQSIHDRHHESLGNDDGGKLRFKGSEEKIHIFGCLKVFPHLLKFNFICVKMKKHSCS